MPVLDILDGVVVRGIAGRRDDYRPIVSRLTPSHEPLAVADAIRNEFGLTHFYVADLDGILKQTPNESLYPRLIANGFQLLVDSGIREASEARAFRDRAGADIVVGLESCNSPMQLRQITDEVPDVTFSLDLFRGVPRMARTKRKSDCWGDQPETILRQAIDCNVVSIIVLDLSDVGMGTGGNTDSLSRFVRKQFPQVRLITGGGVRGRDDLKRLRELGVDAALIASSLHDGRLRREDLFVI